MAANTLAPIDIEINNQKAALQKLKVQVNTMILSFGVMTAKDRARNINEIQKAMESFQRFFDKLKGANIQNTGTRFAADNLKMSFYSLKGQWTKFEMSLNSTRAS